MEITKKQQESGKATVYWISQHLGNFADVIATKLEAGDLSRDDPQIIKALTVITEGKQKLAAP